MTWGGVTSPLRLENEMRTMVWDGKKYTVSKQTVNMAGMIINYDEKRVRVKFGDVQMSFSRREFKKFAAQMMGVALKDGEIAVR